MLPRDLAKLIVSYLKAKDLSFLDIIISEINLFYKTYLDHPDKNDAQNDYDNYNMDRLSQFGITSKTEYDGEYYYLQFINNVNNLLLLNDNYFINLITNYLYTIINYISSRFYNGLDFQLEIVVLNKLFVRYNWPYRLILESINGDDNNLTGFSWFKGYKVNI
jgi:hypothetical protein